MGRPRAGGAGSRPYILLLQVVYDLVYLMVFVVLLPCLLWMLVVNRKYRSGLRERLGFVEPFEGERPRIWIHGVSVGEVLAAKSLVAAIEAEYPDSEIVISTTTRTGQEAAAQCYPAKRLFYYPLDFSFVTRRVIRRVRPMAVILMELEIWPNFLLSTFVTEVPVLLVDGRITERSFRGYRILQRVIPEPMDRIKLYCAQTKRYADRFRALGVPPERIHVTGTMKFDSIATEGGGKARAGMRRELGIADGDRVLMGGSTHPGEEATLHSIFRDLVRTHPEFRLVLVPRHPERLAEVEGMLRNRGATVVRRTALGGAGNGGRPVVLVDTMGELARIYAAADIVFVGGSLVPHGGQNMMEPAGLGRAVLFGPHVFNFTKSVDILLEERAVRMVPDEAALRSAILELADAPDAAREMGERARRVVVEQKGASGRILALLRPFLAPRDGTGNAPPRVDVGPGPV